jgi:hypothetical protein
MAHLTKQLAWSSAIWTPLHTCQNLHVPVHRLLSAAYGPPLLTKQDEVQKLPGYQPHPNVEILLLEHEQANIRMFHISSCWLDIINSFRPKLIPAVIQTPRLQFVYWLPFIYYNQLCCIIYSIQRHKRSSPYFHPSYCEGCAECNRY